MTGFSLGYGGLLFVTYLIALLLSVFPLGLGTLSWMRPEFVCLLSIYWLLYTPHKVGIALPWAMGFVQDIVEGGVWGAHAFAMAIVAYIVLLSYQRLVSYSRVQQMMWVLILIGVHQIFFNWLQGLMGNSVPVSLILLPTIMSGLCWPVMVLILRRFSMKYRPAL